MKKSNKENPLLTAKKRIWKGSKWGSFVAAALGIFVFSLLTVYIFSETENERYVQAENEVQAAYDEVEGNLHETEEDQMMNSIEEVKLKSAQYLKKMAVEPRVKAEEVAQKTEKVTNKEKRLENKKGSVIVEDKINKPIAEAEENKGKEEERLAQKRKEEQASKPKEVNNSAPVSEETEEKEESLDESSPEEELYPMEFTMTDPNGHTFKLSRDFSIYKIGKGYDDIARKYGARFYYTPNSDVSNVIIGRKIIATVSLVSAANVEYKDLFIDLMTFQSKQYTREEFAALVDTVIESGEPYKVEEENSGELLKVENGAIIYHSW